MTVRDGIGPTASIWLEKFGFARLDAAFTREETAALQDAVDRVFRELRPDVRRSDQQQIAWSEFRYEMLNRCGACQRVVSDRRILDVVEPLLGEDCHVIANTAWRNEVLGESGSGVGHWHVDSGPHVPRPPGIPWDDRIPYPVFAIGVHIYLKDCPEECGPTAVIPRSHRSGQAPPADRRHEIDLTCNGESPLVLTANAGDVVLFVSDAWHRLMPPRSGDTGRDFIQIHYGRRDIAQRLRTAEDSHQLSAEALERARSPRERTIVGLHPPYFYDG